MMETRIAFMPILLLALLVLGGILLLVLVVVAARNRTPSAPPRPAAIPTPPMDREARVETLRQLAEQRISVDEAESRLTAMGNPVPAGIPTGPEKSSSGRGCLVAILVFLALIGLGLLAMLAVRFATFHRVSSAGDVIYRSSVHEFTIPNTTTTYAVEQPKPPTPQTQEEATP